MKTVQPGRLITTTVILTTFLFLPLVVIAKTPNDPSYEQQYYLDSIGAPAVWEYTTGSRDIVVAVIDTGVDINHPDLYKNIWRNQGEIPDDGIDNDNNGYADDINGWNFVFENNSVTPQFDNEYSEAGLQHGTLVAGVIGALGNNDFGITGLNWEVAIMPLIALDGLGSGNMVDVTQAINYAVNNGAHIINLSLVGTVNDVGLVAAVQNAYNRGVMVVSAAGNETVGDNNEDHSINLDLAARYPLCVDNNSSVQQIIGVGSIDKNNKKSLFSNYGSSCVDIVAPGEGFYGLRVYDPVRSEWRTKFGGTWSGTSLATPLVSGSLALLKSYKRDLEPVQLYETLFNQAVNIDEFNSSYVGKLGAGGLNIAGAMDAIKQLGPISGRIIAAPQTGGEVAKVYIHSTSGDEIASFIPFADYQGAILVSKVSDQGRDLIAVAKKASVDEIILFDMDGLLVRSVSLTMGYNAIKLLSFPGRIGILTSDNELNIFTLDGDKLNDIGFDKNLRDLTIGDIDDDGYHEIIALTMSKVDIYNQLGVHDGGFAVDKSIGFISVTTDKLVGGAASGEAPYVFVYDSAGQKLAQWLAYNDNFRGGVMPSAQTNGLTTGPGKTGGPHIRTYDFIGNLQTEFFTLNKINTGGVNVAMVD
ncbi:MAG: S8 family serine peptidase [Candidatus Komeilibacteria bacterium]|nr:S8 family serine peptidase [Candidatus Komeilibacteria bacterium]